MEIACSIYVQAGLAHVGGDIKMGSLSWASKPQGYKGLLRGRTCCRDFLRAAQYVGGQILHDGNEYGDPPAVTQRLEALMRTWSNLEDIPGPEGSVRAVSSSRMTWSFL
eukprot:3048392-Amphidinium_carterae.1